MENRNAGVVEIPKLPILNSIMMETIKAIKPGPKPKTEEGKPDQRRRVTPDNQPKHPTLKPHIHKPKD